MMAKKQKNSDIKKAETTQERNHVMKLAENLKILQRSLLDYLKECQTFSTEEGHGDMNDPTMKEIRKLK